MKKAVLALTVFCITVFCFGPAGAVSAGGEYELEFRGFIDNEDNYRDKFTDTLDIEIFLPEFKNTNFKYEFEISNALKDLTSGNRATYFSKKLYVNQKFDWFNLTAGRQPVSWSFGALLNPVDYTLGADTLDEENNSKYTDALEVYIPLNWNSSISLISSFPGGFNFEREDMKWGCRTRAGLAGYDFTLSYVDEADLDKGITEEYLYNISSVIPDKRLGVTVKGDFMNTGVYGASGYYFETGKPAFLSMLLGADYSHNLTYNQKINFQAEYLRIELNKQFISGVDLLTGSINYPLNYFSSIICTAVVNMRDSSLILIPGYQNTLPGNIKLNIEGTLFSGDNKALFSPGPSIPRGLISVKLNYPF
ncbi:MAG: hypothetical protein ACQEQC_06150 [Elusimicrobiota bacterium]